MDIPSAINDQIKEELYSGYLYMAMSAYAASKGLKGLQNWMHIQALEERDHALGFHNFLLDCGGKIVLQELKAPPSEFGGPLQMFQEALKHEQFITGKINELHELAAEKKDYAFQSFLKWYIDEQVEEEATASEMIDRVKLAGETGTGMFVLDKELAARTYTPSSILKIDA
jgi:ferritin